MKKKDKSTEKKTAYSISEPVGTIENKGNKINLEKESTKFVVILLCIVAFIAMLWVVDALKNDKEEDEKEETTVKIDYGEVLVGNMLNQKYDEYVVYAYSEEKDSTVDYLLNSVSHSYILNLDLANNKIAVAETSNFVGTIDQIKFKGETLLLIKGGKITNAYEGSEEIIKYLESITK